MNPMKPTGILAIGNKPDEQKDARDLDSLAEFFYYTFGMATQFRTPTGDPMPRWDAVTDEYKAAYATALRKAMDAYGMAVATVTDDTPLIPFDEPALPQPEPAPTPPAPPQNPSGHEFEK